MMVLISGAIDHWQAANGFGYCLSGPRQARIGLSEALAQKAWPMSSMRFRSVLYVPANNARALEKATKLACDAVILDLEDALAPEAKSAGARLCAGPWRTRPLGKSLSSSASMALTRMAQARISQMISPPFSPLTLTPFSSLKSASRQTLNVPN
jgi:hypothetical protein